MKTPPRQRHVTGGPSHNPQPEMEDIMGGQKKAQTSVVKQAPASYTPVVPGPVPFDCIRAHQFQLVDATGAICGGMGFDDSGDPTIVLTQDSGKQIRIRASLTLDKRGPGLVLADASGTHRLTLSVNDGNPAVMFSDAAGNPRLAFWMHGGERIFGKTWDRKGKPVEFVRRAFPLPGPAHEETIFLPLARKGRKADFARALADTFNIHDAEGAEELWRICRGNGQDRGGKSGPQGGRRRTLHTEASQKSK